MAESEKTDNETKSKAEDSGSGYGMVLLGLTAVAIGVVIKTALESQGVSSVKAELASEATKQVIDKAPKVIKEIVGEVEPYSERSPWENALDLQRMM